MSELFRKLNLGERKDVFVLNAPGSFDAELAKLSGVRLERTPTGATDFVIAFAVTRKQLDEVSRQLIELAGEDAIVWVAYPKGSSKRYKCEFNRDDGWNVLGLAGYEPVRMVAIDEDWSALRFRKAERIGKMIRSSAISPAGKARISRRAERVDEPIRPPAASS